MTDALSQQTTFTYNNMSRLTRVTNPDTTHTDFAYDNRGRRTSVTDANAKVTSYAYDDADRLVTVTDAQTPTHGVTTYAYNTENNLLSITDALGRVTSFTYDLLGRVTQTTFPSTLVETYTYDAVGNLVSKTDRKGQAISYSYDELDRPTHKGYPDSTGVDYTYDAASRLTNVSDPTGTYQFSFDNMGRLTGTTTDYSFLTSRSFTNSYAYDAGSNRTSFTDPESGQTAYVYDTLNRLTTLTPPTAISSGSFGFTYDALSRRTQMTRPNGVNSNYSYDNLSRLLSVLHTLNSTTIDGASYTVDAVGNRSSKTNQLSAVTENYGYDSIYQLLQVTQGAPTESYTYDPVGNRLSSLGVSPYSYNNSNQLTSTPGASYTYDNNGNTLTKTEGSNVTTYAWDFENRLVSVTLPGSGGTVTFKYDPFGRRIQKSSASGTTNYAYDGADITEEADAAGSALARYTMGPGIDQPLAMLRGSATSYYQADGLGSITSLTDGSGSLAASYTYDSFGKLATSSGALVNPFRYTGREFDSETGLYYYRARYYDSTVGRFLREDPIGFLGGRNFYPYAGNNPVLSSDPSGLDYRVSQAPDGSITIYAPITIYGSGANNALASRWSAAISGIWNGHSWRGCNVHVYAPITVDAAATWITAAGSNNYVRVDDSANFRGKVRHFDFGPLNYSFGRWGADSTAGTIGHEFGHFLLLPDQYTDVNGISVSKPGFEGDIMGANLNGNVSSYDLDMVLAGKARGCGCTQK